MEKPLVSIVLCTYNGEKFLAEQIDSILRQTYSPIELIISDDASTDGTKGVLSKYDNQSAIQLFYQDKNIGLTANFSFASSKAKGELIAFSDQDDIWLENKIEKLVASMGNRPLVYSDSLLVDETGNSMKKKLSDLKRMYSGDDSRGYILYSCVWGHGMVVTKKLLQQCLPMPQEVNHDIWIVYIAFLNGGIKYLDEALTHYRQHRLSTSQTLPEKNSVRIKDDRFTDYKKRLRWIEIMQEHERESLQPFYQQLVKLYAAKEKRSYVFPLITFMLKYRSKIFMFSKKGFASHCIEILKQARGVKP